MSESRPPLNGSTAWNKWSNELAISLGRDFERSCLPFLRLIWPTMMRPTPLSKWDRQGVDLLALGQDDTFSCVIQCKTSQNKELDSEAIRRTRASIASFRNSGHQSETFLVLINGDGRSIAFNEAITADLADLISTGRVKKAELWNRQTLLNRTFLRMKEILGEALRRLSSERQEYFRTFFKFGAVYIDRVPVLEESINLRAYAPCERVTVQPVTRRSLPDLLKDSSTARWTLVTGIFGAGKTTAALQASVTKDRTAIFVSARDIGDGATRHGTNSLAQEIVSSLAIFHSGAAPVDGFFVQEPKDEDSFERLAGPALSSILRSEQSDHVLLIDGLDENRSYLHPNGLQLLNNALADYKCPIVLTTRLEHLDSMFGSFETLFEGLGSKGRSKRPARLLTLHLWTDQEVSDFLSQAQQDTDSDDDRRMLETVRHGLRDGSARRFYGDLIHHPLFLQFILEDALQFGLRQRNRTQLITSWNQRKIFRDINHHGIPLSKGIDRYEFAEKMASLMESTAATMTTVNVDGEVELTEFVDSTVFEASAAQIFRTSELSLVSLMVYSVLIPKRRKGGIGLSFSLQVLQEYFLAAYLVRQNRPALRYPRAVVDFYEELKARNPTD
jgi:hypothetical protein